MNPGPHLMSKAGERMRANFAAYRERKMGAGMSEYDEALAAVRRWVETRVDDWDDPVIDPALHDALRIVVGLPPLDRGTPS